MSLPLIVRPAARLEFDEAAEWYERRSAGLGAKFIRQVQQALDRISASPESYPVIHHDMRVTLVKKFPNAVYYRAETVQVVVLAIIHTARNSSIWQGRS